MAQPGEISPLEKILDLKIELVYAEIKRVEQKIDLNEKSRDAALALKDKVDDKHFEDINHETARIKEVNEKKVSIEKHEALEDKVAEIKSTVEQKFSAIEVKTAAKEVVSTIRDKKDDNAGVFRSDILKNVINLIIAALIGYLISKGFNI